MPKAAKLAPAIPTIYIQEVKTSWTKASRGGEGAVSRGRVPEAAELPLETKFPVTSAEGYPFFLHLLSYDEDTKYTVWSQFLKSDVDANKSAEILTRAGVQVSFNGVILTARYKWNEASGVPKRRR